MGAFALLRGAVAETDRSASDVERLFQKQGFPPSERHRIGGWTLVLCRKMNGSGGNRHEAGENACFCVGTFIYRSRGGAAALQAFLDDRIRGGVDWDEAWGCYFLISLVDGRIEAQLDPLGSYKVFCAADETTLSSSFLAAAHLSARRTVDPQGVYEYVHEGATFGHRTVFEEIRLFPSGIVRDLDSGSETVLETRIAPRFDRASSSAEHVDRTLATLRRCFGAIARSSGGKVDTALSGGYDSRLMLALLLDQGVTPKIHVYGRPSDADVTVASSIADGERLALERVDKSRLPSVGLDEFAAVVERNFYALDGTPADGILDSGADLKTRQARCAGGEVMLNGGGGEVFRNFFYLPDRDFTVRQLLWSFYARFDPRAATDRFSESAYHAALGEAVRQAAGTRAELLPRPLVEYLYPAFRCRFWAGRNTAINNRFGHALTPFVEPAVVRSALPVPLEQKQHGAFEASLIASVSPRLAGYPSDYGHDFDGPVPLRRRLKDWATLLRPPWLRRFSFRIQRRMRRTPPPYYLGPSYIRALLPDGLPRMEQFFRTEEMTDWQQYNRLCTVEFLWRVYPPKD